MKHFNSRALSLAFYFTSLLLGCTTAQAISPKLCHMTQSYQTSIAAQTHKAEAYLKSHPARHTQHHSVFFWRNPTKVDAVVFDIDETLLSNWTEIKHSHCQYHPKAWIQWVNQSHASAIKPTIELLHLAQRQGYAIILLTGRHENERKATIKNLHAAGITHWKTLIMKPVDDNKIHACLYKAHARGELAKHYRVVMNVGDQISDFCGSNNGILVKLPNPFYTIPALVFPGPAMPNHTAGSLKSA